MDAFLAGSLGGAAGVLVGHPFDTVKVKLQTQDYRNPLYKGTLDCFKQTVKKDGLTGLYRGVTSPVVGVAGINAVIFGVQSYCNTLFSNRHALTSHMLSGAAAGITQAFIASPVELAKTRLQLQADRGGPLRYKGAVHVLQEIYKSEGARGMFRGQLCTILREAPAFSTYFLTFEASARLIDGIENSDNASGFANFFAGGIAGMASWVISYPVDVIKSRIQSDGAFGPAKYSGIIDCVKQSFKEEGYGVFTRGLNSAIIRSFPTNAATFFVMKKSLDIIMQRNVALEDTATLDAIREVTQKEKEAIFKGEYTGQVIPMSAMAERNTGRILPIVLNASQVFRRNVTDDFAFASSGECLEKDIYISLITYLRDSNSFDASVNRRKLSGASEL